MRRIDLISILRNKLFDSSSECNSWTIRILLLLKDLVELLSECVAGCRRSEMTVVSASAPQKIDPNVGSHPLI